MRILLVSVAALVAVVACALGGLALWLRSDGGHRFLARKTVDWANAHMAGRLEVERVTGPVLGWVRYEGLVLRDRNGRVAGRCRSVEAHYGLRAAARGTIDRLDVDGADMKIAALLDDRLGLGPLIEAFKQADKLDLPSFNFHDTSIDLRGVAGPFEALRQIEVRSSLAMADHGSRGRFDVADLAGHVRLARGPDRPLRAAGRLDYDPHTPLSLRHVKLSAGDSVIAGEARYTQQRVDVDISRLHVAARDFHQALPMENPPAAIDGTAKLHGPRASAGIEVHLKPGKGRVDLTGTADLDHLKLAAHIVHDNLDGAFFPTAPPFIISAIVDATIRKGRGGVVGDTELTEGRGRVQNVIFQRAHVNANWIGDGIHIGRVSLDVPGATVTGSGTIRFAGDIALQSHADIAGLGKFVNLARGKLEWPGPPSDRGIAGADVAVTKHKQDKPSIKVGGIKLAPKIARDAQKQPL